MPELIPHNLVALPDRLVSWGDLLHEVVKMGTPERLRAVNGPIAFVVSDPISAYQVLAMVVRGDLDAVILGRERLTEGVRAVLDQAGYSLMDVASGEIIPPASSCPRVPGRIALLTSGSTGIPKLVAHRWETLFTGRNLRHHHQRRWLLPYQVGTYAWYQVVTLGLFQPEQTLIPAAATDLAQFFRHGQRHGGDSISATPTFWRMALLNVPREQLQAVPLQSITLGGETVDQAVLRQLQALYPQARLTHIYATTETGTCIVVTDRQAGFPAARLQRNEPHLPELQIRDGRLWVRSPFSCAAARGEPQAWIDTGDLVEQRGERIYFLGRADASLINVGGNKAYPADIEAVLLQHPSVAWCRVRPVKAALVGYLPEADLFYLQGKPIPSETEFAAFCQGRLPEYAIPRFWNRLEQIPLQPSLKSTL